MDVGELDVYKRWRCDWQKFWTEADDWPSFAKDSIGTQITQSADSIGANINEGHGRYHFDEGRFRKPERGSRRHKVVVLPRKTGLGRPPD
jgi:hypothetical protein